MQTVTTDTKNACQSAEDTFNTVTNDVRVVTDVISGNYNILDDIAAVEDTIQTVENDCALVKTVFTDLDKVSETITTDIEQGF